MLRKIQVLLVLAAFLVALFPARALAADVGEVRWKSGKGGEYVETKSGRYFKVTRVAITTFEGMENLHRYMAVRSALTQENTLGRGELAYPEEVSLIDRVFANGRLFLRAWVDVSACLKDSRAYDENLRDPEKRYQFWKDKGFYDRYTAQERAFINAAVMPALMLGRILSGVGGVGVAAWGASVLIGGSVLWPAFLVGAGAYAAITLWKTLAITAGASQEDTLAADVAALPAALGGSIVYGATKAAGEAGLARIAGSILLQRVAGLFGGADTLARVIHGLGIAGRHAAGAAVGAAAVGVGSAWALATSNEIARLWNIWNIPEPVSYQELWEEAGVGSGDAKVETVEELSLDYRLTK